MAPKDSSSQRRRPVAGSPFSTSAPNGTRRGWTTGLPRSAASRSDSYSPRVIAAQTSRHGKRVIFSWLRAAQMFALNQSPNDNVIVNKYLSKEAKSRVLLSIANVQQYRTDLQEVNVKCLEAQPSSTRGEVAGKSSIVHPL